EARLHPPPRGRCGRARPLRAPAPARRPAAHPGADHPQQAPAGGKGPGRAPQEPRRVAPHRGGPQARPRLPAALVADREPARGRPDPVIVVLPGAPGTGSAEAGNCGYSALAPDTRITSAHFLRSASRNARTSGSEAVPASEPSSCRRATMSGELTTL